MSVPLWPHRQTPLTIQLVGIGAYRQEISGRFDRCKPRSRYFDRSRTSKAFDCSSHRSLKLIDLWRSLIPRIDILLIPNHRQRNKTIANGERVANGIESNSEIVGVKKSVPLDILKSTLILLSTLCRFTQEETPIPVPFGQMPPFTIRCGSSSHLHQERRSRIGKVMQNPQIKRGAKIVGVRNEEKLLAVAQQRFEKTRTKQRRVDVSVSRRTPF